MISLKILVMVWHLEMGLSQVYEEETRSPFLQLLVRTADLVSSQVDLACVAAAGYCEITPLGLHGIQQVDAQYFPCNFLLTSESTSCQTAYRLDFCAYRLDFCAYHLNISANSSHRVTPAR